MTATAALPPIHATYQGGDPAASLSDLREIIEHAITHEPRTLQTTIGPSEIGDPCDHCLAAKLAGWAKTEHGMPWLPTVGTAVHRLLEDYVIDHENARTNGNHTAPRRFLVEQPVMVGHIGGREVWGHTDVLDLEAGVSIDYKCVGATTLRTAKAGPSDVYRTQAHLYAKGWNDAGTRVDHVAIWYVPRNSVSLDNGVIWHEPYDPTIALEALERANRIHTNLATLATISTEARDAWITGLPRAEGCWDCMRYPDRPTTPAPTSMSIDEALGHP